MRWKKLESQTRSGEPTQRLAVAGRCCFLLNWGPGGRNCVFGSLRLGQTQGSLNRAWPVWCLRQSRKGKILLLPSSLLPGSHQGTAGRIFPEASCKGSLFSEIQNRAGERLVMGKRANTHMTSHRVCLYCFHMRTLLMRCLGNVCTWNTQVYWKSESTREVFLRSGNISAEKL